jgi:integrase/recombinase XerD
LSWRAAPIAAAPRHGFIVPRNLDVDTGCAVPGRSPRRADTTQVCLHADRTIKEQALARVQQPGTSPGRYRLPDTLLAFLDNL